MLYIASMRSSGDVHRQSAFKLRHPVLLDTSKSLEGTNTGSTSVQSVAEAKADDNAVH